MSTLNTFKELKFICSYELICFREMNCDIFYFKILWHVILHYDCKIFLNIQIYLKLKQSTHKCQTFNYFILFFKFYHMIEIVHITLMKRQWQFGAKHYHARSIAMQSRFQKALFVFSFWNQKEKISFFPPGYREVFLNYSLEVWFIFWT